jgi:transcriptional regulatory protein LevR
MKDNILTKESAQQIAVEFLKRKKCTDKVDVSTVEKNNEVWAIRGTCPIDLEGHPWAEIFEVLVDTKGKVKSTSFALL